MAYSVWILPTAQKELARLPNRVQHRMIDRLDSLERQPRPHGIQKLKGDLDNYRIRVGDYRVLYRIDEDRKAVFVYAVGHRKDVYK